MAKTRSESVTKVAAGAPLVTRLSGRERQFLHAMVNVATEKKAYGLKAQLTPAGIKCILILEPFPTNDKSEKKVEAALKPAPTPAARPALTPAQQPKPKPMLLVSRSLGGLGSACWARLFAPCESPKIQGLLRQSVRRRSP